MHKNHGSLITVGCILFLLLVATNKYSGIYWLVFGLWLTFWHWTKLKIWKCSQCGYFFERAKP